MAELSAGAVAPSEAELDQMHDLYRGGGQERQIAPQIVYPEAACPLEGCGHHLQAIDFRLEDHGRAMRDPLVRAWWIDTSFVGRCPHCDGWIHFAIRGKTALTADEAARFPSLPEDWHRNATIL